MCSGLKRSFYLAKHKNKNQFVGGWKNPAQGRAQARASFMWPQVRFAVTCGVMFACHSSAFLSLCRTTHLHLKAVAWHQPISDSVGCQENPAWQIWLSPGHFMFHRQLSGIVGKENPPTTPTKIGEVGITEEKMKATPRLCFV